jgi:hypothetical protein
MPRFETFSIPLRGLAVKAQWCGRTADFYGSAGLSHSCPFRHHDIHQDDRCIQGASSNVTPRCRSLLLRRALPGVRECCSAQSVACTSSTHFLALLAVMVHGHSGKVSHAKSPMALPNITLSGMRAKGVFCVDSFCNPVFALRHHLTSERQNIFSPLLNYTPSSLFPFELRVRYSGSPCQKLGRLVLFALRLRPRRTVR